MATPIPMDNSNDNNAGSGGNRSLCGAPFPPRPKAIATFLSSSNFLDGCQTMLHSLKTHLAPTPDGEYPPEIIVLLSSKVKNAAKKVEYLCPIFCDRVIQVEHIPITKTSNDSENNKNEPSHVQSWDDNCGWTKLRLFELEGYDTILYIDADCLVVKGVGHLLEIGELSNLRDKEGVEGNGETTKGLLAAAPDIFPPDKFNAGVMVLRPSKSVFEEMVSRLPSNNNNNSVSEKDGDDDDSANITCKSYDGGDTGFLNSFYPNWYSGMPSYSRLPFGYNAQRFMHHCTYEKQPKYWDDAIDDIRIIHFSSSPKPWENKAGNSSSSGETKEQQQSYLNENDASGIQTVSASGKLERMWQTAYEKSQQYYIKEMRKRSSAKGSRQKTPTAATVARAAPRHTTRSTAPPSKKPRNAHSMMHKRYKELRKSGMATKEAMKTARAEYGLDKADEGMDPSRAVGQMFGLMYDR